MALGSRLRRPTLLAATLALLALVAIAALAGSMASSAASGQARLAASLASTGPTGASAAEGVCANIDRYSLEKQMNARAGEILAACGRSPSRPPQGAVFSALDRIASSPNDYGGADVNVKDSSGKTALQVVSEQKPRPPRPTAGALVDGEMPAQPAEVAELLKQLASGNVQASNAAGSN